MTHRKKLPERIHSGLLLELWEQRRTHLADNFRIRRCFLIIFSTDPALILTLSATLRTVMLRSSKIAASTWLTVSSSMAAWGGGGGAAFTTRADRISKLNVKWSFYSILACINLPRTNNFLV